MWEHSSDFLSEFVARHVVRSLVIDRGLDGALNLLDKLCIILRQVSALFDGCGDVELLEIELLALFGQGSWVESLEPLDLILESLPRLRSAQLRGYFAEILVVLLIEQVVVHLVQEVSVPGLSSHKSVPQKHVERVPYGGCV